jgi:hypothetical protein
MTTQLMSESAVSVRLEILGFSGQPFASACELPQIVPG